MRLDLIPTTGYAFIFSLYLVKVFVFIFKSIAYCLTAKAMQKNELPLEIVLKPLLTSDIYFIRVCVCVC